MKKFVTDWLALGLALVLLATLLAACGTGPTVVLMDNGEEFRATIRPVYWTNSDVLWFTPHDFVVLSYVSAVSVTGGGPFGSATRTCGEQTIREQKCDLVVYEGW